MKQYKSRLAACFLSLSIRRKILLTFLLIGIVPFLFYNILSNRFTNRVLLEREKTIAENVLQQAILSVEYKLKTYDNLSNFMFNNPSILKTVNTQYNENYFSMYKAYQDTIEPLFQTYYALHPEIVEITLYTSSDLHPYGGYVKSVEELKQKDWFAAVAGNFVPTWTVCQDEGAFALYSTRLIGDTRLYKDINYLSLKIDYDKLFSPFLQIAQDEYDLLITNRQGDLIFSTSGIAPLEFNLKMQEEGDNYMVLESSLEPADWTVHYYKSNHSFVSYVNGITRTSYFIGWIILLFLGIIMVILSVTIIAPIEELTEKIKEVKEGDLSRLQVQLDTSRSDEIGTLFQNFSQMLTLIRLYIEQDLKNELEKKNYQQKILYAQINPHFLYNSLSLINSKAILSGQDEISRMVLLISSFYRTALNKGNETTTLANELLNVRSYVDIQLLSYSEPIHVSYEIDDSLLNSRFPNFILQPLVENAIDHGLKNCFESDKKLHIAVARCLHVFDKEEIPCIRITICDNGAGMEEETIRSLFQLQTSGYGIKNVNDRLHLLYPQRCSLSFESKVLAGTTATLLLPLSIKTYTT